MKITLILMALLGSIFSFASSTSFGIIGDAGRANTNANSVRMSLIRSGVNRTILPGDNLYSGSYDSVWQTWFSSHFTFDVVAIGNHNGGYQKEMKYFGMPAEYYTKVIEGVRYIVLNSDNDSTARTQASWLDQQLNNAHEGLVFLVYHHPSYTVSSFHDWTDREAFQLAVRPIIWKHRNKLTALIVGHDHLASVLHFNDLPVILSGAVQENRGDRLMDYMEGNIHVKTNWLAKASGVYWARLITDISTHTAKVDFVRAQDDRIVCSVVLKTGQAGALQSSCRN